MSFRFDPSDGLVIVRAELTGPDGIAVINLALDTGATRSLVNAGILVSIGCDPALADERYQVTTGSGVEFVPVVTVKRLSTLGMTREGFSLLSHTLPPSSCVDGLLGVDFLHGTSLHIDFRQDVISLS
jgi:predicted aspartyl protease